MDEQVGSWLWGASRYLGYAIVLKRNGSEGGGWVELYGSCAAVRSFIICIDEALLPHILWMSGWFGKRQSRLRRVPERNENVARRSFKGSRNTGVCTGRRSIVSQ